MTHLKPKLRPRSPQPGRCAFCHESFDNKNGGLPCPSCATSLHRSCLNEIDSCPSLGCEQSANSFITGFSIKVSEISTKQQSHATLQLSFMGGLLGLSYGFCLLGNEPVVATMCAIFLGGVAFVVGKLFEAAHDED